MAVRFFSFQFIIFEFYRKTIKRARNTVLGLVVSLVCLQLVAPQSREEGLFMELKKHDSLFFERDFNQCDLVHLNKHIADDLDFYHDQVGIQNRSDFFQSMQENIGTNSGIQPVRKLVENRLKVSRKKSIFEVMTPGF
ncbi:MAG: hypothetical protein AAF717_05930 [Bacteroidota bacterium]